MRVEVETKRINIYNKLNKKILAQTNDGDVTSTEERYPPSAPEGRIKAAIPPHGGVGIHSHRYLFVYRFIGSSGLGPWPRCQEEEHETKKSELDTQGPKGKESGTVQVRRAVPAQGWEAPWVEA